MTAVLTTLALLATAAAFPALWWRQYRQNAKVSLVKVPTPIEHEGADDTFAAELHGIATDLFSPPPPPVVATAPAPDGGIRGEDTGPIVVGWWNKPAADDEATPLLPGIPPSLDLDGPTASWRKGDLLKYLEEVAALLEDVDRFRSDLDQRAEQVKWAGIQ